MRARCKGCPRDEHPYSTYSDCSVVGTKRFPLPEIVPGDPANFVLEVDGICGKVVALEGEVRALTPGVALSTRNPDWCPEVNANLMLAVRALEEAQDRLRRARLAADHP